MSTKLQRIVVLSAVLLGLTGHSARAEDEGMRVAFPSGMNGQIVIAMENAGIAEKNGLKVKFLPFQYGPPMMEALAAGSIDAVVTSLMPVTSYASKFPGDIKIIAMAGQSSHSLMVGKDSDISKPADLAGKKLGVSFGSDSHLDTLVWVKDEGLAGKVALVNIVPADLASALSNKSVDAIVIRQPQVLRLQTQTGARILHSWPFRFVSIVKSKFAADHPGEVEKYLLSLRQAILFVAKNHQQAAEWFGKYLKMDPSIVQKVSEDDPFYSISSLDQVDIAIKQSSRDMIGKWAADSFDEKLIKQKLDPNTLF